MPPAPPGKRDACVLAGLARFRDDQGLEGAALEPEVVEAFVAQGLAGRASSTRGTYRSVLRALSGPARAGPATPFSGSPAPPLYTGTERSELFAIAGSQRHAWRRDSALSFLALGLGAGLRAGELAALRGADVLSGPAGVAVVLDGPRARTVPVEGRLGGLVAGRAEQVGAGNHLFCPGRAERSYPNFVNNFARTLQASPGGPRLCSGRARSSFICAHLVMGTPLAELVYISGLIEVGSLLRYARHVQGAPSSKATPRARWREG